MDLKYGVRLLSLVRLINANLDYVHTLDERSRNLMNDIQYSMEIVESLIKQAIVSNPSEMEAKS